MNNYHQYKTIPFEMDKLNTYSSLPYIFITNMDGDYFMLKKMTEKHIQVSSKITKYIKSILKITQKAQISLTVL